MEGVPSAVPLPGIGTFCDVSSMDACVPLFAKSMSSSQSEGIGHSFLRDVKQWHHPETLHNTIHLGGTMGGRGREQQTWDGWYQP